MARAPTGPRPQDLKRLTLMRHSRLLFSTIQRRFESPELAEIFSQVQPGWVCTASLKAAHEKVDLSGRQSSRSLSRCLCTINILHSHASAPAKCATNASVISSLDTPNCLADMRMHIHVKPNQHNVYQRCLPLQGLAHCEGPAGGNGSHTIPIRSSSSHQAIIEQKTSINVARPPAIIARLAYLR